ncbi:MAG: hypothetical protein R3A51_13660 [Nannocystaceae bacterium]|nr:hypothetical protein [Myxococcales bacterium]
MTSSLPTTDNPLAIGAHSVYFIDGRILVAIYRGDVAPDEILAVISAGRLAGVGVVATITDVGEMGSFGAETRKALVDARPLDLLEGIDADVAVYVVNADVVRRAVMTLVSTASRLFSKRHVRMQYVKTIAQAERLARAYVAAVDAGQKP